MVTFRIETTLVLNLQIFMWQTSGSTTEEPEFPFERFISLMTLRCTYVQTGSVVEIRAPEYSSLLAHSV